MTEVEADKFIADYRALIKTWIMAVAGISDGDADGMQDQLDGGQDQLAEIALAFPSKAYSVDLLINSRKRKWAGYGDERVQRTL